jgi:preprotein translocase subunit SecE
VNRETKRMLQRQGQMEADGSPAARKPASAQQQRTVRQPRPQQTRAPLSSRTVEFVREVRSEWRQVAWPTRTEIFNSSLVVLVVLVALVSFIFGLNWLFSHGFLDLFSS